MGIVFAFAGQNSYERMLIFKDNIEKYGSQLSNQLIERDLNSSPGSSIKRDKKKTSLLSFILLGIPIIGFGIIIAFGWQNPGASDNKQEVIGNMEATALAVKQEIDTSANGTPKSVYYVEEKTATVIQAAKDTVVKDKYQKPVKAVTTTNNIDDLIKVVPSYKVENKFVKDLQFSVSNLSANNLDLVVLEVWYQNHKGKVVRKETLYAKDIQPLGRSIVTAPTNSYNEKITCKVSLVSAKDANLYMVCR